MKIYEPYALNEQGRRQNQEDAIYPPAGTATEKTRSFLVCDGMGGHLNGEVASSTVCESFADTLENADPEDFNRSTFERALEAAYDRLDEKDVRSATGGKMGTTLTFLHLNSREAFMAHIGDSRIYQVRLTNGEAEIVFKTADHSLVNELLRAGVISPEEAADHPKKNVITRAMQPQPEKRRDADIHTTSDVRAGDYFFMCSDGVLESVDDETLTGILSRDADDETKIKLIGELCAAGSKDNYSAYLIQVTEGVDRIGSKNPPVEITGPPKATVNNPPIRKRKRKPPYLIIIIILIFALSAILLVRRCGGNEVKPEPVAPPKTVKPIESGGSADKGGIPVKTEIREQTAGSKNNTDAPPDSLQDKSAQSGELIDALKNPLMQGRSGENKESGESIKEEENIRDSFKITIQDPVE